VTNIVSKPEDTPVVKETLKTYEETSGAKINIQKSKALALGSWNISVQIMDIPYYEAIKVLGIHIQKNTHATAKQGWNKLTSRIRAQAQEKYQRAVDLDQRIRYVHEYLLARAWYMAQILLPPDENLRQINTTISWFLWKGEIFRFPLSILQRTKKEGGWGMIHPAEKCMAFFFSPCEGAKQEDLDGNG
jgi:hypothetical protein